MICVGPAGGQPSGCQIDGIRSETISFYLPSKQSSDSLITRGWSRLCDTVSGVKQPERAIQRRANTFAFVGVVQKSTGIGSLVAGGFCGRKRLGSGFSPGQPPTIHYQNVAMQIVARGRSQENNRAPQLLWRSPAGCRNSFENPTVPQFVRTERCGSFSGHIARRDGVYVNTLGRPFIRQCLCELRHTAFCRCIGGHEDATLKRK
jgi:hypothetical protein